MKLIRSFAGAALATAVLAIAPPTKAQETTLQVETNLPATHATSRAMEIFKDEVARLSKGSIEIEAAAGSPRGLKELVDAVHVGSLFATPTSIANFSRVVPEAAALSLPFIFDNYDEALRAVDGPVGRLMATKIEAKGFTVLAWMALGEFNFTNSKRPIKTLDDFKGLKIRVLPNATHLATFQAIGARPVGMDLKDVAAALRQGDVDGEEQDYDLTYSNKYYESQKYLSDTRHILEFHVFVANKKAFESLDPMQQKAVREAAAIAAVQQRKMVTEVETAALARLQEVGMQFDPLPRETRVALRRATASVVEDVKKWVGADVVNKVLAASRVAAAVKEPAAARVPAGVKEPAAVRVPARVKEPAAVRVPAAARVPVDNGSHR
jgi:tripartite ATP-independent transporter DctP family solute receptor